MKRLFLLVFMLTGCAAPSVTDKQEAPAVEASAALPDSSAVSGGKYYLDDGPPADGATNAVADAVPNWEEIKIAHNRPYTALGRQYYPRTEIAPYRETGLASWYGKRYHGRKTALGEVYDMHKMTAAHPTLPIPSYARVTRVSDGRNVVVRINDRGPFLGGRLIDLSYAAAQRLGFVASGTAEVIVDSIVVSPDGNIQSPDDIADKPEKTTLSVMRPSTEAPADISRFSLSSTLSALSPTKHLATSLTVAPSIYIQLGVFSLPDNATRLIQDFMASGFSNLGGDIQIKQKDGRHHILVGPYPNRQAAGRDDGILCTAGWCGFLVAWTP